VLSLLIKIIINMKEKTNDAPVGQKLRILVIPSDRTGVG
jgi:hypothetical protein